METARAAAISPDNYNFLEQYIRRESGIVLGPDKAYLVQARLQPLVDEERLSSLDQLCDRLRHAPSESLRRRVTESMTTHETLFFRDPAVFDLLRTELLPEIARRNAARRTIRIWSAACSSGQEPYSLAMLMLEAGYGDWNVEILGTDLSSKILEKAVAGTYLQMEMNRGLPAPLMVKYFERAGLDWRIRPNVRRMVRFAPFDLRQSMASLGPFDLALCRNVLIYFDQETRKKILTAIRSRLVPDGFLLLGASETTFPIDHSFVRRAAKSTVVYQAAAAAGARV